MEESKAKVALIGAGQSTTITFDWDSNTDIPIPATVFAKVEVTPTDPDSSCSTIDPVTSFVLVNGDSRTFLPSRNLEPVKLLPDELGGPIIKGPPIKGK